jgi:hypothetical protein
MSFTKQISNKLAKSEASLAPQPDCKHEFMPPLLNGNTSCIRCGKSENWNEKAAPAPPSREEQDFLNASIAVWREIDRLMTLGPYPGIPMADDLRISEKLAWERYKAVLDKEKI